MRADSPTMTQHTPDFRLLETMRLSEDGTIYLLDGHLARLRASATFFGFRCDIRTLRTTIESATANKYTPSRIRLLLSANGDCNLEYAQLSPDDLPRRLKLSTVTVNSKDPYLYHKTTNRGVYEQARSSYDRHTDVILVNERNELTETTIANIALLRNGRWITPPVSCGLLPGVMREELLAAGSIEEGVTACDQLVPGETVRCFNSVRGTFDLPFATTDS